LDFTFFAPVLETPDSFSDLDDDFEAVFGMVEEVFLEPTLFFVPVTEVGVLLFFFDTSDTVSSLLTLIERLVFFMFFVFCPFVT
jgi:hypothetical protein